MEKKLKIGLYVSLVLLVIAIFLNIILSSKAEARVQPCCTAEIAPFEEATEPEIVDTKSSRSSSGSYIQKQVAPVYVRQVLKFGDVGENVKTFQKVLNNQINAGLVVDGIFGEKTQSAWLAYELTIK